MKPTPKRLTRVLLNSAADASFKPLANRKTVDGAVVYEIAEDGFIQLVPKGRAPNALEDGTPIMQVVDDAAIRAMYNNATMIGGRVLIDDEHFSRDPSKSTDAQAWVEFSAETLQARPDGLYGKPDFTPTGLAVIKNGIKLFISPEFPAPPSKGIEQISPGVFRPLSVVGFGLTNRPNFRTAKPLANRDTKPQPTNLRTMLKPHVAALFGVTETELDGLNEEALKNRFKTVTESIAAGSQAAKDLQTLQNRQADEFITANDGALPKDEATRKHLRETFLTNRGVAESMVNAFKAVNLGPGVARGERKPLHNRETAKAPAEDGGDEAKEVKAAKVIKNRAHQLVSESKGTRRFSECFAQATAEQEAAE